MHENNIDYIKKYLIYCVLQLERPSCQHMTRWLNNNNAHQIIKPRTLLNISEYNSFDELLYHYIDEIIKHANNLEAEFLLIIQNWVSLDKPIDMNYNEQHYNSELLFDKRIAFIKNIIGID